MELITCSRDSLPSDIPWQYLHKKKIYSSQINKVDRFFIPAVSVGIVDEVN